MQVLRELVLQHLSLKNFQKLAGKPEIGVESRASLITKRLTTDKSDQQRKSQKI
jgi:hypothetical protein